jgi:thiol-disulfide isomerase/thioredoxin
MKFRFFLAFLLLTSVARADEPENWRGRTLPKWIVAQSDWMNTPRPLWLSGQKGHVVVLEFFRIGCSHCENAAPTREKLWQKYRGRGVRFIGFHSPGFGNEDENNWRTVQRTVRQWNLTYPIAFDRNGKYFGRLHLRTFPTVFVLDRNGVVQYQGSGFTPKKARDLNAAIAHTIAK